MKATEVLRRPYYSLSARLEEPYNYVAEAFTREKQFRPGSILRDPTLNKLGLHPLRMALSFGCRWARTHRSGPPTARELAEHAAFFRANGYVAVPNFAGAERFELIKKEVDAIMASESYYHHEQDGSTQIKRARLNRQAAPACDALLRDPRLTELVRLTSGFSVQRVDMGLEVIRHGDEKLRHDGNKDTHSDTFHPTLKLWYFVHDVGAEHGPLTYYPRSNRLTWRKLRWAYESAQKACKLPQYHGSFRPTPEDLKYLNSEEFIEFRVAADTLVLVDTHGFHRRGPAEIGATRVAFWGSLRPNPFTLDPGNTAIKPYRASAASVPAVGAPLAPASSAAAAVPSVEQGAQAVTTVA